MGFDDVYGSITCLSAPPTEMKRTSAIITLPMLKSLTPEMTRLIKLMGCLLILAAAPSTRGDVVWSDDFSSGDFSRNFPGGIEGADYTVGAGQGSSTTVNGQIGNSAPSANLSSGGGTSSGAVMTVKMNQFAPFTVGPTSSTPLLRVSFDFRVDYFGGGYGGGPPIQFVLAADTTNSHFVAGRTLNIAFHEGQLSDGDPNSDLTLFADTQVTPQNRYATNSSAIGLIPGTGWRPGFDFGGFYSLFPVPDQDTNDEFYRFTFIYDSITGAISGTATRVSTGETAPFPAGLSLTPGTTFSSDDPNDFFTVLASPLIQCSFYVDNIVFEALSDDGITTPPVLTKPAPETRPSFPVQVSFTLPENALPGSVKLSFGETILTLAAAAESAGAHSFSFDPVNPTASPFIASGSPVPDGVYAVTLSYQDDNGNPAGSATSANVTIDRGVTQPPVLTGPAAETRPPLPVPVSFSLPENALPGSVKLSFGGTILTLAGTMESAGSHSFSFDPSSPVASPDIASGSPIPDGVYAVTLSYRDLLGNAAASATNANVVIDQGITQLPVLSAPDEGSRIFTPVQVSFSLPEKALPGSVRLSFGETVLTLATGMESAGSHSFSFDPANPTTSSHIVSGAPVGDGVYAVTLSYQDHLGNPVASVTSENVSFDSEPRELVRTVLFGEGEAVPASAGLPAEAVWRKFGMPAVNAGGDVVFNADWVDATGKGAAVFGVSSSTDELRLILKRGAPVPGAGTESLPVDAVVAKLRDPIVAANGDVLAPVTLAGKGITNANDAALIWLPRSTEVEARVVVREGQELASGKVKAITAAEVGSAGVAFTAVLTGKGINGANDLIACVWTPLDNVVLMGREGQTLEGVPLKRFNTLGTWANAPGHGRGMASLDSTPLKLGFLGKFTDGHASVLTLESGGVLEVFAATGASTGGSAFKTLGLPAWAGSLTAPVYLGTLEDGTKGVFQYDADSNASQSVVMVGAEIEPGILLKSANDPVVSNDGTRKAWVGTAKGASVTNANNQVLVMADGTNLSVVVREGTSAAEAPAGARWKSVTSVAMPAHGPLLLGSLRRGPGGITAANDVGVWGMDSSGRLRSLFREGDMISGKQLKTHAVLKAVAGTPGVTRSWNDAGDVVWLATFTDGSSAIIKTRVP